MKGSQVRFLTHPFVKSCIFITNNISFVWMPSFYQKYSARTKCSIFFLKCVMLSGVAVLFQSAIFAQLYSNGKTLTTSHGLTDNYITCIHQDRKGYMWIGTRKGLNRYDGYNIIQFLPKKGNSISNEVINDIAEDKKGRIWVATMRGLNCYDPTTGKWEAILYSDQPGRKALPSYLIWSIKVDKNGLLWIASDVREFSSYNIDTKKFTYYDWPAFAKKMSYQTGNGYHSIRRFEISRGDVFWMATNRGLVQFDAASGRFSLTSVFANSSDIADLKHDETAGKIYITQQNGNIYSYDTEKKSFVLITAGAQPYPSEKAVNQQYKILLSSPKGLLKVTGDNEVLLSANAAPLLGALANAGVNATFISPQGTHWVGTPLGLYYTNDSKSRTHFLPLISSQYNETVNNMGGVYFDPVEELYFVGSVKPASVFIINRKTGLIRSTNKDALGNPLSGSMQIKALPSGSIWLLTQTGIYQYHRKHQNFVPFPPPWKTSPPAYFTDIAEDSAGDLWIGSFAYGYARFSKALKRYEPVKHKNNIYLQGLITGIVAASGGTEIWFSTYGYGLSRYNVATGELIPHSEYLQNCKMLEPLSLANDIEEDAAGNLWAATAAGGVFKFRGKLRWCEDVAQIDMTNGLAGNQIVSLTPDSRNRIWLLFNDGISVIDSSGAMPNQKISANLFMFSGNGSSPVYRQPLYYNSKYDELLFGVSGGLLIHSPYKKTDISATNLLFTSVKVNQRELYGDPRNWQEFSVPEKIQQISFSFAAVNFEEAESLTYQYKLDGFDDNWQSTSSMPVAEYKNLSAGNYVMNVKAIGTDGRELGHIQSSKFIVTAPFWKKGWFITVVIAGLLFALYFFIIRFYRRRLNNEKIVNRFATSLYGHHSLKDIFWDVANNCILLLGFEDCVIYQLDKENKKLVQVAAAGPKQMGQAQVIFNPIEIQLGKGIVGSVAKSGTAERVANTAKDSRYILDDEKRMSEITVPIFVDGKVFGIIDSEHRRKNFFTRNHLKILTKVADVCSGRLVTFLTEDNLRMRIARDLHDEMGSTLTSINILSKIAMQAQPTGAGWQYLDKINKHSGNVLESMGDIIWAINPHHDTVEDLIARMKEVASELMEPTDIDIQFHISGTMDKTGLNPEERKFLYLIFKEALNNALKYSGGSLISVTFEVTDRFLKMEIQDNGQGFEKEEIKPGNGLNNMENRAKTIGAELLIKSRRGGGTSVILQKPIV